LRDVITGRLALRSRASQKIISADLFKKFLPHSTSALKAPKYGIGIKFVNGKFSFIFIKYSNTPS
jgi:hypothetical protein